MNKFLLMLCVVLSTGCIDPEAAAVRQQNRDAFNKAALEQPVVVGELADGRIVHKITLRAVPLPGHAETPHVIYYIGSDVSVNWAQQSGKFSSPQTAVTLGITSDMPLDEVLRLANQAKTDEETRERQLLQQLTEKYKDDH